MVFGVGVTFTPFWCKLLSHYTSKLQVLRLLEVFVGNIEVYTYTFVCRV